MACRRAAVLAIPLLAGCATPPSPAAAGELLDALFAPPRASELAAVRADWAARDTGVRGWRVEWRHEDRGQGRTLAVSHVVDGFRHYGLVRIPPGGAGRRLPVLVVAHGGDAGATRYQFFRQGAAARGWVQVVPSFRSERLIAAPLRWYRSEGPPSPWDRDVDDAMALLGGVLEHVPEADPSRVAVLGRSRGGGVALLMAARDPRVQGVVTWAAPTDFLLPEVRRLAQRAIRSRVARLPGAGYLADSVLFALRDGRTTVERARLELVRRSAAYFAERLPPAMIHHGMLDDEVPVAHGERIDAALRSRSAGSPPHEYHRYPDGGHRPVSMPGSAARTDAFLGRIARGELRRGGEAGR
ncbi:MAG TPA: prolyl oligopeptidase family serine peptidase [Longimicrobium sp.]|nr:prolyl oligopeptidase family serine peptidase [Longimicrobium sp.]